MSTPNEEAPPPPDTVPFVNKTSLLAFTLPWQFRPPQDALVVIVKGTFRLVPGGPAVLCEEQRPPSGDVGVDEDPDAAPPLEAPADEAPPPRGTLAYASDFALFKPQADVTLTGHAYPRDDAPNRARVGLQLGASLHRQLLVQGDRVWQSGSRATAPVPFERLPLVWERAFGGPGHPLNPVGRGHEARPGDPQRAWLPNLELASAPVASADDEPPASCPAPMPPDWPARASKQGDYKRGWLKTRAPYFPEDFDWSYFNAAPPEQRVPYPQGGEPYRLEGVHAEHAVLEGTLPLERPRVFAERHRDEGGELFEVRLVLDTVHFEPDALELVLVWRGQLEVRDPYASELQCFHLLPARCDEEPYDLAHAQALAHAPPAASPEEATLAEGEVDPRPGLAARGAVGEPTLAPEPPPAPKPTTRDEVIALLARGATLAGRDLSGVDLSRFELGGQDLSNAQLEGASLAGSRLEGTNLEGCVLAGCDLTGAQLTGARLVGADLTGAKLEGATLREAVLDEATLAGVSADGVPFDRCSAQGADFTGAFLGRATFASAQLGRADFTDARLEGASFAGAVLDDARVYNAHARGADFSQCSLADFRADEADLREARFVSARAKASVWEAARLSGASFEGALLEAAVLSRAVCERTVFNKAQAKGASFRRAKLREAKLLRADLENADFESADLSSADLRGANLHEAEFLRAKLTRADWTLALVTGTRLAPR